MKKIISSIVIVLIGYFFFTVYYAGNKTDSFFNNDDGIIYKEGVIAWKTASSNKTFFSGSYDSEILVNGIKISSINHKIDFGMKGLNPFDIGKITYSSTYDLKNFIKNYLEQSYGYVLDDYDDYNELVDKLNIQFNGVGTVSYNGLNIATNIKNDTHEISDFILSWDPIISTSFISFDKNHMQGNIVIPKVEMQTNFSYGENIIASFKNQKYNFDASKKNIGVWIGKYSVNIDEILINNKEDNFTELMISKLGAISSMKEGKNSTLESRIEVSLNSINAPFENTTLSDVNLDIVLENLDLESFKKINDTLSGIDVNNKNQIMVAGITIMSYIPALLEKQPKFVINDFSGKFDNKNFKVSGFAQYIGDIRNLSMFSGREDALKELSSKISFNIDKELFYNTIKNIYQNGFRYYYLTDEEIEEEINSNLNILNIKTDKESVDIIFEIKDGKIIINDKDITQDLF